MSFLRDCTTYLRFNDYQSPPLAASNGIPQGYPLSPILYLFYSSDLLELVEAKDRNQFKLGYIDDTAIGVISDLVEENIQKLEEIAPSMIQWQHTHGCRFDVPKFHLVHFTRNKAKYKDRSLTIDGTTINPEEVVVYLGACVDRELRWRQQVEKAVVKGTQAMLAVGRLAKSMFGLADKYARRLFTSVVIPQMEYGLVLFFEPIQVKENGHRRGLVGIATRLGRVQRLAVRLITGAFKTTATDTLNFHAGLPPIILRLNQSVHRAAVQLATLPDSHPLHKIVTQCTSKYPRLHCSPIHQLMHAFPDIRGIETIDPRLSTPCQDISARCSFHISPS